MKTKIITTAICLASFICTATAQNSWTPAPSAQFTLEEPTKMLSRNEPFFGAELEYSAQGAVIKSVIPNSPAEEFNFKKGDIITAIGGATINSEASYQQIMESNKPGNVVTVSYLRKGTQKQKKVKLETITVYKKEAGI